MDMLNKETTLKSTKEICGEKTNFTSTIGLGLTNISQDVKLQGSSGSLTS